MNVDGEAKLNMFTAPLDILLVFMVSTPPVGWLLNRKGYRKAQGIYPLVGLSFAAYFLYGLYMELAEGDTLLVVGQLPFNPQIEACLQIDMLSVFMAFLYVTVGFLATAYSVEFMKRDSNLVEYYTLMLGMVAGLTGTVFAGDFFTLFVFWELMCLTSYALVAFRKQSWEPIEAGFKYLVMSTAASATTLFSMSLLYGLAGTLNFAALSTNLPESEMWSYVALAMVIVAFGVKAAIVPFHTWLPDAHSAAPSPVSAMLSGVMVQTGVYAIIRVLPLVFASMHTAWQPTLAVLAVFSMFGGNILALLQDDLKRLLAFSTIAHVGYILFGFSTISQQGLAASLFHIWNHAIMKGLLFLCAGAVVCQTGVRDLKKLEGIRRTMPATSLLLAVGSIAIAAIPPLNGFWSELLIVLAGLKADMLLFSALMVVNILLSTAYYLRLIYVTVLKEPTPVSERATEVPKSMLIPMSVLAFLCLIIGFCPEPLVALAQKAAEAVLPV